MRICGSCVPAAMHAARKYASCSCGMNAKLHFNMYSLMTPQPRTLSLIGAIVSLRRWPVIIILCRPYRWIPSLSRSWAPNDSFLQLSASCWLSPDTDSQDQPTVVFMCPEMSLKDHSMNFNAWTAQVYVSRTALTRTEWISKETSKSYLII